jgi:hypothetical protein
VSCAAITGRPYRIPTCRSALNIGGSPPGVLAVAAFVGRLVLAVIQYVNLRMTDDAPTR